MYISKDNSRLQPAVKEVVREKELKQWVHIWKVIIGYKKDTTRQRASEDIVNKERGNQIIFNWR